MVKVWMLILCVICSYLLKKQALRSEEARKKMAELNALSYKTLQSQVKDTFGKTNGKRKKKVDFVRQLFCVWYQDVSEGEVDEVDKGDGFGTGTEAEKQKEDEMEVCDAPNVTGRGGTAKDDELNGSDWCDSNKRNGEAVEDSEGIEVTGSSETIGCGRQEQRMTEDGSECDEGMVTETFTEKESEGFMGSSGRSSINSNMEETLCMSLEVGDDPRLTTRALKDLAKVLKDLNLPLKFHVENESEVELGRYSGGQMKKIFQNAMVIFGCNTTHLQWGELWEEFYLLFCLVTCDPPEGKSRVDVANEFQLGFDGWKVKFKNDVGGYLNSDWRIYLHIMEKHVGDLYQQLGNLQPWASEAGEQLHALDRMFVFQRRRRGPTELAADLLTTAIRVRQSHVQIGNMQTPSQIPTEIKSAQPHLACLPQILSLF
jgi:hypothetical protein